MSPMDMNRTASGIFLDFLVSSISTVIEKIIPLSIAILVSNSEPYFSSSFIVLSEEFP